MESQHFLLLLLSSKVWQACHPSKEFSGIRLCRRPIYRAIVTMTVSKYSNYSPHIDRTELRGFRFGLVVIAEKFVPIECPMVTLPDEGCLDKRLEPLIARENEFTKAVPFSPSWIRGMRFLLRFTSRRFRCHKAIPL
jgi:hypothetical protein